MLLSAEIEARGFNPQLAAIPKLPIRRRKPGWAQARGSKPAGMRAHRAPPCTDEQPRLPLCFPTSGAKQPSGSSLAPDPARSDPGEGEASLAGIFIDPGCEVPDPPAFPRNKDSFCASLLERGVQSWGENGRASR